MSKRTTIEHRPKPPIDKVIGGAGGIVVAIGIIWGLTWIDNSLGYMWFFTTVGVGALALLLIASLVDRRRAARKAGRPSDRS